MEWYVHDTDLRDPDGGRDVLAFAKEEHPGLEKVRADSGYGGSFADRTRGTPLVAVEIIRQLENEAGFVVLARRWVVERTFAWLLKCRRLARDCDRVARNNGSMEIPGIVSPLPA